MPWLAFTLTPFLFSSVVQLSFLPAFHELSATPSIRDFRPLPHFFFLGIAFLVIVFFDIAYLIRIHVFGLGVYVFGPGVKVRLVIVLYFYLLIIHQGLGLFFCRSIYKAVVHES